MVLKPTKEFGNSSRVPHNLPYFGVLHAGVLRRNPPEFRIWGAARMPPNSRSGTVLPRCDRSKLPHPTSTSGPAAQWPDSRRAYQQRSTTAARHNVILPRSSDSRHEFFIFLTLKKIISIRRGGLDVAARHRERSPGLRATAATRRMYGSNVRAYGSCG